jgi:hypothetical protein
LEPEVKGPRRFLPHLLLGLSIAGASVARASDIEEAAKTLVGQLAAGDFKAATSRFDSRMQASLPADKLGPLWNQLVG